MIYYCYVDPGDNEHAFAYGLLRYGLNEYGINNYFIEKESGGRPYIAGDPVYFSITHTKGLCAVVVSRRKVGVDGEKNDRDLGEKLIKRIFTPAELTSDISMIGLWTLKEAAAKLSGRGVAQMLEGIEFNIDTLIEKQGGCIGRIFNIGEYTLAVCEEAAFSHDLKEIKRCEVVRYI